MLSFQIITFLVTSKNTLYFYYLYTFILGKSSSIRVTTFSIVLSLVVDYWIFESHGEGVASGGQNLM